MNILFVCSANMSRSFLAEKLLGKEVEMLNLRDVSVSSAGLYASGLNQPDRNMVEYLSEIGIPSSEHRPKQISKKDINRANIILVMENAHATMIRELWPEAKDKLELFGKFVSAGPMVDDIVDPFGRSSYHYRLARSQLTLAIKNFANKLLLDQENRRIS